MKLKQMMAIISMLLIVLQPAVIAQSYAPESPETVAYDETQQLTGAASEAEQADTDVITATGGEAALDISEEEEIPPNDARFGTDQISIGVDVAGQIAEIRKKAAESMLQSGQLPTPSRNQPPMAMDNVYDKREFGHMLQYKNYYQKQKMENALSDEQEDDFMEKKDLQNQVNNLYGYLHNTEISLIVSRLNVLFDAIMSEPYPSPEGDTHRAVTPTLEKGLDTTDYSIPGEAITGAATGISAKTVPVRTLMDEAESLISRLRELGDERTAENFQELYDDAVKNEQTRPARNKMYDTLDSMQSAGYSVSNFEKDKQKVKEAMEELEQMDALSEQERENIQQMLAQFNPDSSTFQQGGQLDQTAQAIQTEQKVSLAEMFGLITSIRQNSPKLQDEAAIVEQELESEGEDAYTQALALMQQAQGQRQEIQQNIGEKTLTEEVEVQMPTSAGREIQAEALQGLEEQNENRERDILFTARQEVLEALNRGNLQRKAMEETGYYNQIMRGSEAGCDALAAFSTGLSFLPGINTQSLTDYGCEDASFVRPIMMSLKQGVAVRGLQDETKVSATGNHVPPPVVKGLFYNPFWVGEIPEIPVPDRDNDGITDAFDPEPDTPNRPKPINDTVPQYPEAEDGVPRGGMPQPTPTAQPTPENLDDTQVEIGQDGLVRNDDELIQYLQETEPEIPEDPLPPLVPQRVGLYEGIHTQIQKDLWEAGFKRDRPPAEKDEKKGGGGMDSELASLLEMPTFGMEEHEATWDDSSPAFIDRLNLFWAKATDTAYMENYRYLQQHLGGPPPHVQLRMQMIGGEEEQAEEAEQEAVEGPMELPDTSVDAIVDETAVIEGTETTPTGSLITGAATAGKQAAFSAALESYQTAAGQVIQANAAAAQAKMAFAQAQDFVDAAQENLEQVREQMEGKEGAAAQAKIAEAEQILENAQQALEAANEQVEETQDALKEAEENKNEAEEELDEAIEELPEDEQEEAQEAKEEAEQEQTEQEQEQERREQHQLAIQAASEAPEEGSLYLPAINVLRTMNEPFYYEVEIDQGGTYKHLEEIQRIHGILQPGATVESIDAQSQNIQDQIQQMQERIDELTGGDGELTQEEWRERAMDAMQEARMLEDGYYDTVQNMFGSEVADELKESGETFTESRGYVQIGGTWAAGGAGVGDIGYIEVDLQTAQRLDELSNIEQDLQEAQQQADHYSDPRNFQKDKEELEALEDQIERLNDKLAELEGKKEELMEDGEVKPGPIGQYESYAFLADMEKIAEKFGFSLGEKGNGLVVPMTIYYDFAMAWLTVVQMEELVNAYEEFKLSLLLQREDLQAELYNDEWSGAQKKQIQNAIEGIDGQVESVKTTIEEYEKQISKGIKDTLKGKDGVLNPAEGARRAFLQKIKGETPTLVADLTGGLEDAETRMEALESWVDQIDQEYAILQDLSGGGGEDEEQEGIDFVDDVGDGENIGFEESTGIGEESLTAPPPGQTQPAGREADLNLAEEQDNTLALEVAEVFGYEENKEEIGLQGAVITPGPQNGGGIAPLIGGQGQGGTAGGAHAFRKYEYDIQLPEDSPQGEIVKDNFERTSGFRQKVQSNQRDIETKLAYMEEEIETINTEIAIFNTLLMDEEMTVEDLSNIVKSYDRIMTSMYSVMGEGVDVYNKQALMWGYISQYEMGLAIQHANNLHQAEFKWPLPLCAEVGTGTGRGSNVPCEVCPPEFEEKALRQLAKVAQMSGYSLRDLLALLLSGNLDIDLLPPELREALMNNPYLLEMADLDLEDPEDRALMDEFLTKLEEALGTICNTEDAPAYCRGTQKLIDVQQMQIDIMNIQKDMFDRVEAAYENVEEAQNALDELRERNTRRMDEIQQRRGEVEAELAELQATTGECRAELSGNDRGRCINLQNELEALAEEERSMNDNEEAAVGTLLQARMEASAVSVQAARDAQEAMGALDEGENAVPWELSEMFDSTLQSLQERESSGEIDFARNGVAIAFDAIQRKVQRLDELAGQIYGAGQRLNGIRDRIEGLDQRVSDRQRAVDQAQQAVDDFEEQAGTLSADEYRQLSELRFTLEQRRDELAEAEAEKKRLENEQERIEQELNTLQSQSEQITQSLDDDRSNLEGWLNDEVKPEQENVRNVIEEALGVFQRVQDAAAGLGGLTTGILENEELTEEEMIEQRQNLEVIFRDELAAGMTGAIETFESYMSSDAARRELGDLYDFSNSQFQDFKNNQYEMISRYAQEATTNQVQMEVEDFLDSVRRNIGMDYTDGAEVARRRINELPDGPQKDRLLEQISEENLESIRDEERYQMRLQDTQDPNALMRIHEGRIGQLQPKQIESLQEYTQRITEVQQASSTVMENRNRYDSAVQALEDFREQHPDKTEAELQEIEGYSELVNTRNEAETALMESRQDRDRLVGEMNSAKNELNQIANQAAMARTEIELIQINQPVMVENFKGDGPEAELPAQRGLSDAIRTVAEGGTLQFEVDLPPQLQGDTATLNKFIQDQFEERYSLQISRASLYNEANTNENMRPQTRALLKAYAIENLLADGISIADTDELVNMYEQNTRYFSRDTAMKLAGYAITNERLLTGSGKIDFTYDRINNIQGQIVLETVEWKKPSEVKSDILRTSASLADIAEELRDPTISDTRRAFLQEQQAVLTQEMQLDSMDFAAIMIMNPGAFDTSNSQFAMGLAVPPEMNYLLDDMRTNNIQEKRDELDSSFEQAADVDRIDYLRGGEETIFTEEDKDDISAAIGAVDEQSQNLQLARNTRELELSETRQQLAEVQQALQEEGISEQRREYLESEQQRLMRKEHFVGRTLNSLENQIDGANVQLSNVRDKLDELGRTPQSEESREYLQEFRKSDTIADAESLAQKHLDFDYMYGSDADRLLRLDQKEAYMSEAEKEQLAMIKAQMAGRVRGLVEQSYGIWEWMDKTGLDDENAGELGRQEGRLRDIANELLIYESLGVSAKDAVDTYNRLRRDAGLTPEDGQGVWRMREDGEYENNRFRRFSRFFLGGEGPTWMDDPFQGWNGQRQAGNRDADDETKTAFTSAAAMFDRLKRISRAGTETLNLNRLEWIDQKISNIVRELEDIAPAEKYYQNKKQELEAELEYMQELYGTEYSFVRAAEMEGMSVDPRFKLGLSAIGQRMQSIQKRMQSGSYVFGESTSLATVFTFGLYDPQKTAYRTTYMENYQVDQGISQFINNLRDVEISELNAASAQLKTLAARSKAMGVAEEGLLEGLTSWNFLIEMSVTFGTGAIAQSAARATGGMIARRAAQAAARKAAMRLGTRAFARGITRAASKSAISSYGARAVTRESLKVVNKELFKRSVSIVQRQAMNGFASKMAGFAVESVIFAEGMGGWQALNTGDWKNFVSPSGQMTSIVHSIGMLGGMKVVGMLGHSTLSLGAGKRLMEHTSKYGMKGLSATEKAIVSGQKVAGTLFEGAGFHTGAWAGAVLTGEEYEYFNAENYGHSLAEAFAYGMAGKLVHGGAERGPSRVEEWGRSKKTTEWAKEYISEARRGAQTGAEGLAQFMESAERLAEMRPEQLREIYGERIPQRVSDAIEFARTGYEQLRTSQNAFREARQRAISENRYGAFEYEMSRIREGTSARKGTIQSAQERMLRVEEKFGRESAEYRVAKEAYDRSVTEYGAEMRTGLDKIKDPIVREAIEKAIDVEMAIESNRGAAQIIEQAQTMKGMANMYEALETIKNEIPESAAALKVIQEAISLGNMKPAHHNLRINHPEMALMLYAKSRLSREVRLSAREQSLIRRLAEHERIKDFLKDPAKASKDHRMREVVELYNELSRIGEKLPAEQKMKLDNTLQRMIHLEYRMKDIASKNPEAGRARAELERRAEIEAEAAARAEGLTGQELTRRTQEYKEIIIENPSFTRTDVAREYNSNVRAEARARDLEAIEAERVREIEAEAAREAPERVERAERPAVEEVGELGEAREQLSEIRAEYESVRERLTELTPAQTQLRRELQYELAGLRDRVSRQEQRVSELEAKAREETPTVERPTVERERVEAEETVRRVEEKIQEAAVREVEVTFTEAEVQTLRDRANRAREERAAAQERVNELREQGAPQEQIRTAETAVLEATGRMRRAEANLNEVQYQRAAVQAREHLNEVKAGRAKFDPKVMDTLRTQRAERDLRQSLKQDVRMALAERGALEPTQTQYTGAVNPANRVALRQEGYQKLSDAIMEQRVNEVRLEQERQKATPDQAVIDRLQNNIREAQERITEAKAEISRTGIRVEQINIAEQEMMQQARRNDVKLVEYQNAKEYVREFGESLKAQGTNSDFLQFRTREGRTFTQEQLAGAEQISPTELRVAGETIRGTWEVRPISEARAKELGLTAEQANGFVQKLNDVIKETYQKLGERDTKLRAKETEYSFWIEQIKSVAEALSGRSVMQEIGTGLGKSTAIVHLQAFIAKRVGGFPKAVTIMPSKANLIEAATGGHLVYEPGKLLVIEGARTVWDPATGKSREVTLEEMARLVKEAEHIITTAESVNSIMLEGRNLMEPGRPLETTVRELTNVESIVDAMQRASVTVDEAHLLASSDPTLITGKNHRQPAKTEVDAMRRVDEILRTAEFNAQGQMIVEGRVIAEKVEGGRPRLTETGKEYMETRLDLEKGTFSKDITAVDFATSQLHAATNGYLSAKAKTEGIEFRYDPGGKTYKVVDPNTNRVQDRMQLSNVYDALATQAIAARRYGEQPVYDNIKVSGDANRAQFSEFLKGVARKGGQFIGFTGSNAMAEVLAMTNGYNYRTNADPAAKYFYKAMRGREGFTAELSSGFNAEAVNRFQLSREQFNTRSRLEDIAMGEQRVEVWTDASRATPEMTVREAFERKAKAQDREMLISDSTGEMWTYVKRDGKRETISKQEAGRIIQETAEPLAVLNFKGNRYGMDLPYPRGAVGRVITDRATRLEDFVQAAGRYNREAHLQGLEPGALAHTVRVEVLGRELPAGEAGIREMYDMLSRNQETYRKNSAHQEIIKTLDAKVESLLWEAMRTATTAAERNAIFEQIKQHRQQSDIRAFYGEQGSRSPLELYNERLQQTNAQLISYARELGTGSEGAGVLLRATFDPANPPRLEFSKETAKDIATKEKKGLNNVETLAEWAVEFSKVVPETSVPQMATGTARMPRATVIEQAVQPTDATYRGVERYNEAKAETGRAKIESLRDARDIFIGETMLDPMNALARSRLVAAQYGLYNELRDTNPEEAQQALVSAKIHANELRDWLSIEGAEQALRETDNEAYVEYSEVMQELQLPQRVTQITPVEEQDIDAIQTGITATYPDTVVTSGQASEVFDTYTRMDNAMRKLGLVGDGQVYDNEIAKEQAMNMLVEQGMQRSTASSIVEQAIPRYSAAAQAYSEAINFAMMMPAREEVAEVVVASGPEIIQNVFDRQALDSKNLMTAIKAEATQRGIAQSEPVINALMAERVLSEYSVTDAERNNLQDYANRMRTQAENIVNPGVLREIQVDTATIAPAKTLTRAARELNGQTTQLRINAEREAETATEGVYRAQYLPRVQKVEEYARSATELLTTIQRLQSRAATSADKAFIESTITTLIDLEAIPSSARTFIDQITVGQEADDETLRRANEIIIQIKANNPAYNAEGLTEIQQGRLEDIGSEIDGLLAKAITNNVLAEEIPVMPKSVTAESDTAAILQEGMACTFCGELIDSAREALEQGRIKTPNGVEYYAKKIDQQLRDPARTATTEELNSVNEFINELYAQEGQDRMDALESINILQEGLRAYEERQRGTERVTAPDVQADIDELRDLIEQTRAADPLQAISLAEQMTTKARALAERIMEMAPEQRTAYQDEIQNLLILTDTLPVATGRELRTVLEGIDFEVPAEVAEAEAEVEIPEERELREPQNIIPQDVTAQDLVEGLRYMELDSRRRRLQQDLKELSAMPVNEKTRELIQETQDRMEQTERELEQYSMQAYEQLKTRLKNNIKEILDKGALQRPSRIEKFAELAQRTGYENAVQEYYDNMIEPILDMGSVTEESLRGRQIGRGSTAEVYEYGEDVLRVPLTDSHIQTAKAAAVFNYLIQEGFREKYGTTEGIADLKGVVNVNGKPGLIFERVQDAQSIRAVDSTQAQIEEARNLLARLHALGVVHQDIGTQVENIVVDANGKVWLIDFATAIILNENNIDDFVERLPTDLDYVASRMLKSEALNAEDISNSGIVGDLRKEQLNEGECAG